MAQEAQFKTSYNISLAALEEAKGTLLAYDNIAIGEGPQPGKASIQARDQQAGHFQFGGNRLSGPYHPAPINHPPVGDPVVPQPSPDVAPLDPKIPLPAPLGPNGPRPSPMPPMVPAGEPNFLSRGGANKVETQVQPASIDSTSPPPAANADSPPNNAAEPSSPSTDLPPVNLPPLPGS